MLAGANAQRVSFPGVKSETKSPDGRYLIRNTDDEKQEPAHTLTLIDAKDGSTTKVYSYPRGVDVLWSPTSRAFVVNDYEGSDASHPVLFTAPWTSQPIDLREKLVGFLHSGRGAKSVLDNHHVYFSAQRWLSGDEILCQVTGYGDVDPKGFTAQYVYKLGAGFRLYR
jgi:dipeptidyl aminopeptidase/acylaminoacyl peptidase